MEVNTKYGPLKIADTPFRGGSVGQNIPAVFRYDPTGLRATTTATWGALEKELQKVKLDHLSQTMGTPEGWAMMAEDNATKGRPMAAGPRYRWKKMSADHYRVKW